ncbi:lipoyl protein ligase domain-containing protein [Paracandidimonas soli]|uniref:lipoyl protein ligase domain-containing protein n=1 Tax=Paracandidimonas soli TaxID=1917182 RepID=UPI003340CD4A
MQVVRRSRHERHDSRADEWLMRHAADHGPIAALWHARQGLVVPRTYQRHATFPDACEALAESGWPVSVRQSGGGIVPQGRGILNLSLCYPHAGLPMDHSETAYQRICEIIRTALSGLGIAASAQAVQGSFCDGRYNLAVGRGDQARKIVGTAQLWRRMPGGREGSPATQVVLAHAVILAAVDCELLTERINRFEALLGTGVVYRPDRIASLHTLAPSPADPDAWMSRMEDTLARRLASWPKAMD